MSVPIICIFLLQGCLLMARGNLSAGEQLFKQALTLDPRCQEALYNLGYATGLAMHACAYDCCSCSHLH